MAKIMLNSFWDKFGQRENQSKTSIVDKLEEFFKMMTNPSIEMNSILPVNDEIIVVNWKYKEESYDLLTKFNVVIAAYVTALARLELYSYLDELRRRVMIPIL